jgi:hypothetical protein
VLSEKYKPAECNLNRNSRAGGAVQVLYKYKNTYMDKYIYIHASIHKYFSTSKLFKKMIERKHIAKNCIAY